MRTTMDNSTQSHRSRYKAHFFHVYNGSFKTCECRSPSIHPTPASLVEIFYTPRFNINFQLANILFNMALADVCLAQGVLSFGYHICPTSDVEFLRCPQRLLQWAEGSCLAVPCSSLAHRNTALFMWPSEPDQDCYWLSKYNLT
jgi:hypothetical protein